MLLAQLHDYKYVVGEEKNRTKMQRNTTSESLLAWVLFTMQ